MNLLLAILFVMAGGSLGAISRFLCQKIAAKYTSLPGWVPICIINIVGSVLIGLAVAWLTGDIKDLHLRQLAPIDQAMDKLGLQDLIALIAVGFCGAFTTFSTFSLDNFFLSINKKGQMVFNMVGTTLLAYGGVTLGWYLGTLAANS